VKGSDILNQLRQNANRLPGADSAPTPQVTDPKIGDDPNKWDDGSEEASDRCGLENSRYAQQGLVLVETSTKRPIGVYYAAFQNSIRWLEPCCLEFVFEDDRGYWRVDIIGGTSPDHERLMELLLMRLIGQKRELLRANGSFIKEIRITQMEEEGEDR
jgi:hypothetical protein